MEIKYYKINQDFLVQTHRALYAAKFDAVGDAGIAIEILSEIARVLKSDPETIDVPDTKDEAANSAEVEVVEVEEAA